MLSILPVIYYYAHMETGEFRCCGNYSLLLVCSPTHKIRRLARSPSVKHRNNQPPARAELYLFDANFLTEK